MLLILPYLFLLYCLYKYNLYQKFKNVYTSLDEYIDEINTITSDDGELKGEYGFVFSKLVIDAKKGEKK